MSNTITYHIVVELEDTEGDAPAITSSVLQYMAPRVVEELASEGLTCHIHLVDPERGNQTWRLDDLDIYEDEDEDDLVEETA